MPDHSVVHRYARCLSYPEWGVGSVNGIYFTGGGDDVQQWARVSFQPGIRTVPAGSLQFVDFSKPDPGAERVERFMTAAKHALAEGNFKLAARRLVFARDAQPGNPAVLRLMTLAFWQAGDYSAAARAVRDWIRSEPERPAPYRYAARIYESMGSLSQAVDAAERETAAAPNDGTAWERLGRLRLRRFDREGAREALERARATEPSVEGLLDLALVANLSGRHRRRGQRLRAGDRARARTPRSRGRASRTRSRARTGSATACRPASARWSSATTPRCATCATRSPGSPRGSSRAGLVRRPELVLREQERQHDDQRRERDDRDEDGVGGVVEARSRQPGGEQRAEAGDGEAAAHRAEELDRGRGDADLGSCRRGSGSRSRTSGTSCPCRAPTTVRSSVTTIARAVGVQQRQQDAAGQHEDAAHDREHLVAAGARDVLAGGEAGR